MDKYVAFEVMTGDSKFFDTVEDAEKWLNEQWEEGVYIPDIKGSFIAEVKRRGNAEVVDKMENYKCDHADRMCDGHGPCGVNDCGGTSKWPYERGHDEVTKVWFDDFVGGSE